VIKPIFAFIDSTQSIPLGNDTAIIAPFFADSYTINGNGVVYYKVTPTSMIVIWDSVRYSGSDVDGWNTFQLIITDGSDPIIPAGNNVSFCYPVIQWACSDSSGGFSGYGGTPAFVGVNKGDGSSYAQIGTFSLPGAAYFGPFSTFNGVDWLDFQGFYFNTCVAHDVIAPLVCNNVPDSNLYYICPCDTASTDRALGAPADSLNATCDTVSFIATFLCAVPDQYAVLSYAVTGRLNVSSVYTSTASLFDTIIVQAIPAFGDTGIHYLSLIATDTVAHVSSRVTYTIDVTFDCAARPPIPPDTIGTDTTVIDSTHTGISALQSTDVFSVYPNPASRSVTLSYPRGMGSMIVKMYSILGEEELSQRLNGGSSDIDVSGMARGLYFVKLFKDGVAVSVKKTILL
jgi:hypothetical protein